ncbi:MAG: beta-lactamase family protein [Candidatus Krumholzibacteriota bacterium]|nr:beta-lactamase family protein [Candidatus Krumholzibacteriota bacterium]
MNHPRWIRYLAPPSLVIIIVMMQPLAGGKARGGTEPVDSSLVAGITDSLFHEFMRGEKDRIPGGMVIAVNQFGVFFTRAYGRADEEKQRPFDVEGTVFPVASISKLFTSLAVMQLVEKGRVALEKEVTLYLEDCEIENRFDQPVTIRHLLTHTAGIEPRSIGSWVRDPRLISSPVRYPDTPVLKIIYPPGKLYLYSNRGMAALARVVEKISGIPFPEYVSRNITSPLGMLHSGFAPDDSLLRNLMVGYTTTPGKSTAGPLHRESSYSKMMGAAGLFTTSGDMGKFMLACLNNGKLEGARIIGRQSLHETFRRQFEYHPSLELAMGYGWHTRTRKGVKSVFHRGSAPGVECLLILFPWKGIGFFLLVNHPAGAELIRSFTDIIHERCFNSPGENGISAPRQPPSAPGVRGFFRPLDGTRSSIEKLEFFPGQGLEVKPGRDGLLSVEGVYYREGLPLLFKGEKTELEWYFMKKDGKVLYMTSGLNTYRPLRWHERKGFQLLVLIFCLGSFLSSLGGPVMLWLRKKHTPAEIRNRFRSGAGINMLSVSILNLVFMALFFSARNHLHTDYGVSWPLRILFTIPLVSTVLSLGLPIFLLVVWTGKRRTLPRRLQYAAVTLAAMLFTWFLEYWNLLGYNF